MARNIIAAAGMFAVVLTFGSHASAGIYTDDLSKCLVSSASQADKDVLIEWVFAAMSTNPVVKSMSSVTPEQRTVLTRSAAELMQRLLVSDCRKETVAALKYEGDSAFETSFGVLGQVAMRGLMSDPVTDAELQKLAGDVDKDKLADLWKEAGLTLPPDQAAPAK
jgi:hypothetical protein